MTAAAVQNQNAPLSFAKERSAQDSQERPWKLLVVDDEPEVHSVTRLALSDFHFDGRKLQFINAYSGAEACGIVENDPEIAVMLLDVVMETEDAGLKVVEYVRRMLGNNFVRIILRTGHPGMAPERRVIKAYDINDYRAKTELTQDRMFSLMYTSLRAYKRISSMAQSRRQMAALAEEYKTLLDRVAGKLEAPTEDITKLSLSLQELLPSEHRSAEIDHALSQLQLRSQGLASINQGLHRLAEMDHAAESNSEFNSGDVLDDLAKKMEPTLTQHQALISHGELPLIRGNAEHFSNLLEQLIDNALRYQEDDSPSISVMAESRGKDWEFSVADRGKGIPADQMESCFQAFTGAEQGIGLALCRRIVAEFGGRIWAEARPGGGAVFKFSIPASGAHHEIE
ncbi:MAG: ATP-binding protein [Oceanococcus sp.]